MLSRILIGVLGVTAVFGVAGSAAADPSPTPAPTPVLPNVNAYTPISPVDYTRVNGTWYAFAGPPGVTCVINRQNTSYGCSGPLPGAPDASARRAFSGRARSAPNRWITAPEVFWDYCGPRVICMERMYGVPMDEFDELERRGIDGELVLRRSRRAHGAPRGA